MGEEFKTRSYRSPVRAAQAAQTRRAILLAAKELFTAKGYGCTVAEVAERAGVSVDTVYTSAGRKPALVLMVIDMVLGEADEPIPAEQRAYVQKMRAAPTSVAKLELYADALASLLPTVAPLQEALREAGRADAECARTWQHLVDRRAGRMLALAAELRATGELREDLTDAQVADILWSMTSAEYYLLLAQRQWTPQQYGRYVADAWTRVLLKPDARLPPR